MQGIRGASGEPAIFGPYATVGAPKSLMSFLLGGDVHADLATLVQLLAVGRVNVHVGWSGSGQDFSAAAKAFLTRSVDGKAVVDVS